jgi:hypothetical protein
MTTVRQQRKKERRLVQAMRLQALYQALEGDWVDSRVEWHDSALDAPMGFFAYGLPILTKDTEFMWLGKTFAGAHARVLSHRRRALKPERVRAGEKVADVICAVADAVASVAK